MAVTEEPLQPPPPPCAEDNSLPLPPSPVREDPPPSSPGGDDSLPLPPPPPEFDEDFDMNETLPMPPPELMPAEPMPLLQQIAAEMIAKPSSPAVSHFKNQKKK